jgi:hypothetical protein
MSNPSDYETGFRDALRAVVAMLNREADLDPDPSGGHNDRPNWAMQAITEIEQHFAMKLMKQGEERAK